MAKSITIYKNNSLLFEAESIQLAASYLANKLDIAISQFYDPIERGYVYNIPYYVDKDTYYFVAEEAVALKRRKELEESGHKNARRIWLIPANPNDYDIAGAFNHYGEIDWKRSYNYENGDIIFIYVSGDVQKVRYKVEVTIGVVRERIDYDESYWLNVNKHKDINDYNRSRIRLVDEVNTDDLSLEKLRKNGLKGNIQGARKLSGNLLHYIDSFFTHDFLAGYYPNEVIGDLIEGKRTTIQVNKYERNPIARKQCIEHHGIKCQVCDIDFQSLYGEVGRDFIHVHHIIPLSEVGENYVVKPKEDLIPVCPNCHAMLHRKENGVYLKVEELRERLDGGTIRKNN